MKYPNNAIMSDCDGLVNTFWRFGIICGPTDRTRAYDYADNLVKYWNELKVKNENRQKGYYF